MKLCPNCRTANDDDAKFCKECATPFTANAAGYAAAQEAVKEKAPLDELIGRFKKTSVASESQPSLWQKTKGWVRSNYYVMFFIVMIVLVFVVLIIGVNNSKKDLTTIPASTTSSVSSLVSSEVIPEVVKVSESDITEVDYVYYLSHPDKMVTGKHYRVSGSIEDLYLGNKMIVLKDSDGKELRASMQKGCDLSALSENDYELIPKLDLMNRKELAPNDDGTSKMNEGKIVVSLLFIAHEKFSKTVHVRMKQLDDPSARLKVWVLFLLFFLFPSRNNVGLIMTIGDGFLLSCIASIKAKILGMFFCYFWASNHYIIERVFQ